MAYDIHLEDRIQQSLKSKNIPFKAKKMMGGLSFMVNDKMCVGIIRNNLMIRIDPEKQDELLKKEGCKIMDFTKRPMKGFLYVEPIAIDLDHELEYWINLALEYNSKTNKLKTRI